MLKKIPKKELEDIISWCDDRAEKIPNIDWFVIRIGSRVELCSESHFKRLKKEPTIIYRRLKKSKF